MAAGTLYLCADWYRGALVHRVIHVDYRQKDVFKVTWPLRFGK